MIGLLQMSVSAAVLTAVILIVRALFLNRLSKRTFKILWAVVIARMLIPFSLPVLPHIEAPAGDKTDSYNKSSGYVIITEQGSAQRESVSALKKSSEEDKTADIHTVMVVVWICGAAIAFGFFTLDHFRRLSGYRTALPCKNALVRSMVNNFGTKRKINIRVSDEISSPFTYGVIYPTILLTERMVRLDRSQLEFLLAHEVMHIKKNDVLYKWFLTLAVCIHWFNPLAWVMLTVANRDIELVCDEAVLKSRDDARRDYALALLNMEEKRISSLCAGFGSSSVKERIVTIMKFKRTTIVGIAASICLVAGSMAVFAAESNDSGSQAAQQTVSAADGQKKEIPDVAGMDQSEAAALLESEGYTVIVRMMYSDEVSADKVISYEISENGEVTLFVSVGSLGGGEVQSQYEFEVSGEYQGEFTVTTVTVLNPNEDTEQ